MLAPDPVSSAALFPYLELSESLEVSGGNVGETLGPSSEAACVFLLGFWTQGCSCRHVAKLMSLRQFLVSQGHLGQYMAAIFSEEQPQAL